MITCLHLKRPLALQLQVDWIQPNVNFFHLVSYNQVQRDGDCMGMGMYWNSAVWWLELSLKMNRFGACSHSLPPLNPAPTSILIQASSSDECQRQTWRGKRKWLVPYNLGHITEHHISKWWARFSNKFALIINVPVSFNCYSVYINFLMELLLEKLKYFHEILVDEFEVLLWSSFNPFLVCSNSISATKVQYIPDFSVSWVRINNITGISN